MSWSRWWELARGPLAVVGAVYALLLWAFAL